MDYSDLEFDFDLEFDTVTDCEHCGEEDFCAFIADPFLEEVNPEDGPHPKSWWCQSCYKDRKEEA